MSSSDEYPHFSLQSSKPQDSPSRTRITLHGLTPTSHCGYCKKDEYSRVFGFVAKTLTTLDYQLLIDRGWRRSGVYIYRLDYSICCCPYYTIRCDTSLFKMTKHHKKAIKSIGKMVMGPNYIPLSTKNSNSIDHDDFSSHFYDLIEKYDSENCKDAENQLRVVIEPAAYSDEKFNLYSKYQKIVHKEKEEKTTPGSFNQFLCRNSLTRDKFPDSVGTINGIDSYGAHHMLYYLNNKLIAIGVIDILPYSISSVYFIYDPDYSKLSLGTYGALREIALVRKLSQSLPDLKYYQLGYYIHSCVKMAYKGQFKPSELLDPVQNKWVPFEDCVELMNEAPYFTTFLPHPVTNKILRRINIDDELQVCPSLDISNISPEEGEIIGKKEIYSTIGDFSVNFLRENNYDIFELVCMYYVSVGKDLYDRIDLVF
ncbi:hypothetical protein BB559_003549 [Furculomyces boomerangus]|uniref:arginyltransferase n=1 Tax=Furculomyces boomerangus TaxID=61424 RepID=A0A2T9Y010_9FUNG|nr:hypothetical protein BB559_007048 [Furculomyces boomerangus]PVU85668.1 hypothetical protein BB559_006880 [Furculomyces boomerangus]PVU92914.1 hypothetical protein BB559_003549 [Furculomyces boomerangus]